MAAEDVFIRMAELFEEDCFGHLLTAANLVAADHVCEDDLWVITPTSMIRKSILHAVCERDDLRVLLLEHVPEDLKHVFHMFASMKLSSLQDLEDDEKVALRLLDVLYANDTWVWARDAFMNTDLESSGMRMDGFTSAEVCDAIIRLVTLA